MPECNTRQMEAEAFRAASSPVRLMDENKEEKKKNIETTLAFLPDVNILLSFFVENLNILLRIVDVVLEILGAVVPPSVCYCNAGAGCLRRCNNVR